VICPALEWNDRVILQKNRQVGATTLVVIRALWLALTNENHRSVVVGPNDSAKESFIHVINSAILRMYVPPLMTPVRGRNDFDFQNGSQVQCMTNDHFTHHDQEPDIDFLALDEFGFFYSPDQTWEKIRSLNARKIFACSTRVEGRGNLFNETYDSAAAGQNDFHSINC